MSDWFSASLKLQRQPLDAQRRSLAAGQAMVGASQTAIKLQDAGRKAAAANLAAWDSWARLWGIK